MIALKAGVFTILSILAAYGVVAYVAEGGWAGQLIGIDSDLPVPPFVPVMMFAVTFGLAMDYEVFIVSRMKEERERLGDAREAVIVGLARTGVMHLLGERAWWRRGGKVAVRTIHQYLRSL